MFRRVVLISSMAFVAHTSRAVETHGTARPAAPSPAAQIAKGDSCWNAQRSWDAFVCYTDAEKRGCDERDVAWRLARIYTAFALTARSQGDEAWNYEHAHVYAERAVGYDSNNVEGLIALAVYDGWRTYMEPDNDGKLRASRNMHDEVARVLALDPSDDFAWNLFGQWNREVARLSWIEKIAVKVIYGGLPDASFEQSLYDLQHAIALRPQRIMHYVELAKTYLAMGRTDDARATLNRALQLPHNDGVDDKEKDEANRLLSGLK